MWKSLFTNFIPQFDFIFLQSLAIALIAALLPKLKVNSLLAPLFTILLISWFNNIYWDSRLFFQLPDSFSLDVFLLIIINSIILYIIIKLIPGIEISGLPTAIYTSILLTVSSYFIAEYKDLINWEAVFNFIDSSLSGVKSFFTERLLNE